MGRYSRAIYGSGKYGLDLWTEKSVEPMAADIEVDNVFSHSSSFTNDWGECVYDRVQVSWLAPQGVDRSVLMRSNLGYPTGPTDPFAATLYDSKVGQNSVLQPVALWATDPFERSRVAYLDRHVEPGREYFYAVWTYVASAQEWIESGRAMVTTSSDHGLVDALRAAMPAYMWNTHGGPGDGIDVLPDADQENHFGRFLQGMAWDLDKTLTKVDLMRQVWDPQRTPAVVLDDAISMYGLPNEPALGARASRALLANAAEITGERGSLLATGLLVESLTGFATDLQVGSNLICSTDESSFEGMAVVGGGNQTVVSGTGRWYFTNATKTRVSGDTTPAPGGGQVQIARTPNSDDDWGAGVVTQFQGQQMLSGYRYGLRLAPKDVNKDTSMTLGERIKVTKLTGLGGTLAKVTTAWVHGLEVGDKVSLTLDGGASSGTVTVLAVLDNFNVRVDVAGTPAFVLDPAAPATPADGYLFGGMIPVYQGVPVQELKQYSLVGKFQGATGAKNFSLEVTYWDRYGTRLGTITATPSSGLAALPAWSTSYNSGSAPAGAVSATVAITLTQIGAAQFLGVDSLMLKPGGTPFNASLNYETDVPFDGSVDYTYEDARLLTITINPTKTPSNGPIPVSILADHRAVVEARLTAILATYLPAGTAFVIRWAPDSLSSGARFDTVPFDVTPF